MRLPVLSISRFIGNYTCCGCGLYGDRSVEDCEQYGSTTFECELFHEDGSRALPNNVKKEKQALYLPRGMYMACHDQEG